MRLFYATRDGQSARIASHIAARLTEKGIEVLVQDLASAFPTPDEITEPSPIVVVASIRYGRHLPEAERLLALYRTLPSASPLVLASVNLTARKTGKDTAEGNAYLRKWIARHKLEPVLATAFAGRLDYPRYHWFDRVMI